MMHQRRTNMKLRIEIYDKKEKTTEVVYILPMKMENGDEQFLVAEHRHGTFMFKVLADEGYMQTAYYYPVDRYVIIDAMVVEE